MATSKHYHFATPSVALALALGATSCDEESGDLSQHDVSLEHAKSDQGHPGAVGYRGKVANSLPPKAKFRRAEAELEPTSKSDLSGSVKLEEVLKGVRIAVNVQDAEPGRHAVIVHASGGCEDFTPGAPKQHFAPVEVNHGLPSKPDHHLGDLGNIEVTPDGEGRRLLMTAGGNLRDDKFSFIGRPVVLYEREDDGSGKELGAPIACGMIHG